MSPSDVKSAAAKKKSAVGNDVSIVVERREEGHDDEVEVVKTIASPGASDPLNDAIGEVERACETLLSGLLGDDDEVQAQLLLSGPTFCGPS